MERPENGQADQQLQRRPGPADASEWPTPGFFPSHTVGLTGAEAAPKTRESAIRPTLNGDHDNGNSDNGPTTQPTAPLTAPKKPGPFRTAWDLPDLIRPLPVRKRPRRRRPRLLPHYPAVVEFVWQNRYVIASQVRRRFAEYIPSARTMHFQLASLVQLGYLGIAPVRSTSPNFPFVYFCTGRGTRLIRETYAKLGYRREPSATETARRRGTGLSSLLHELFITEFDLGIWEAVEQRPDIERLFVERRYFRREKQLRFQHEGKTCRVIPDSGFMLRFGVGSAAPRPLLHFFEMDNGTIPMSRIREKFHAYDRWARSAEGKNYLANVYGRFGVENSKPNFRLLVIAHANRPSGDFSRLVELIAAGLELPIAMRDRIWLTTVAAIRAVRTGSRSEAEWFRLRKVRRGIDERSSSFVARLTKANGQKYRKQLAIIVRNLPRRTLLPVERPPLLNSIA